MPSSAGPGTLCVTRSVLVPGCRPSCVAQIISSSFPPATRQAERCYGLCTRGKLGQDTDTPAQDQWALKSGGSPARAGVQVWCPGCSVDPATRGRQPATQGSRPCLVCIAGARDPRDNRYQGNGRMVFISTCDPRFLPHKEPRHVNGKCQCWGESTVSADCRDRGPISSTAERAGEDASNTLCTVLPWRSLHPRNESFLLGNCVPLGARKWLPDYSRLRP